MSALRTPSPDPAFPTPSSLKPHSQSQTQDAPPSISRLTPPPSTKKPRAGPSEPRRYVKSASQQIPSIEQVLSPTPQPPYGAEQSLSPSPDISSLSLEELRAHAQSSAATIADLRLQLSHSHLQYTLLESSSQESSRRAEVDHELTRREVAMLGSGISKIRARLATSPEGSSAVLFGLQTQIEQSHGLVRTLEEENNTLKTRLKHAKRLIFLLNEDKDSLAEKNRLLKRRIRENREHVDALNHSLSGERRRYSTVPRDTAELELDAISETDPFGALLVADKMLRDDANGKARAAASLPNTPQHRTTARFAHEYETPRRTRETVYPATEPRRVHYAPSASTNVGREFDRESTISDDDMERVGQGSPSKRAARMRYSIAGQNGNGVQKRARRDGDNGRGLGIEVA